MTANIAQQVVPRQRIKNIPYHITGSVPGGRKARNTFSSRSFQTQRGSVSSGTLTFSLGFIALAVVALLGFFYLQQVIGTTSQGTDIHAIESQIVELRDKQRSLELEGAELRSLQTIEQNVEQLNLIKTDKVTYLADTTERVALVP